jgi:malonyl-ACP decarboxylase
LTKALITGAGIVSAIGAGKNAVLSSLREPKTVFGKLQREGREGPQAFVGAEIPDSFLTYKGEERELRNTSLSGRVALQAVEEALQDANLNNVEPRDIGLVVGGSNLQLRENVLMLRKYEQRAHFTPPHHALRFMDTDICGLCTNHFNIQGFAYSVGAASASSQVALIKAVQEIEEGRIAACVVVGALTDLSFLELQAFTNMGAMAVTSDECTFDQISRPFDENRRGFVFGEACAAIVLQAADHEKYAEPSNPYAMVSGYALNTDANRGPEPNVEGEVFAITQCIKQAGWQPVDVDYVNTHGTGSLIGDETELEAIGACQLNESCINASKELIGHSLMAAGLTETVLTVLQMQAGFLHGNRNLIHPISKDFNWVGGKSQENKINKAITLSMGFGGINSAVALANISNRNG